MPESTIYPSQNYELDFRTLHIHVQCTCKVTVYQGHTLGPGILALCTLTKVNLNIFKLQFYISFLNLITSKDRIQPAMTLKSHLKLCFEQKHL
jgi:hypothetical protein